MTTTRTPWTLSLLLAASILAPAHAQAPDPRDYDVVRKVPREAADRWLKEELRRSGATLDRERYHFVIGFSTGHYGSDPVHAIAMRRLAFGWLNNTFAAGDRVTPAAWEMRLWDAGQSITLTEDPRTRAAFVDAVPYAPQPGSRGGHDTERALFETVQKAVPKADAASTVVLLLTNTNQSQVPTGSRERLFGAGNPELSSALRTAGFRAPVRHTFTAEGKGGPLTIDVTALFPQKAKGLSGAPDTPRYPTFPLQSWQPAADRPESAGDLPNPTASGQEQTAPELTTDRAVTVERKDDLPWPLIAGAILAVLAILAFVLLRRKNPNSPIHGAPVTPTGRPLPGSIRATVGRGAAARTTQLEPITTASKWVLTRSSDGVSLQAVEADKPLEGTVLVRLSLDEKGLLRVVAEPDTHLKLSAGQNSEGDSREIRLRRDGRALCEVQSATTSAAHERLELVYSGR